MLRLGFIGAGTVGTALAVMLSRKSYDVAAVSSRSRSSAEKLAKKITGCRVADNSQDVADSVELVFITTPDDNIAPVVDGIRWREGQNVVHCSGAASTDILQIALAAGTQTGAFHPLQTFASVEQAIEIIAGSTFAIEAHEPLLTILKDMSSALCGNFIELKAGDKAAYHTAAVIACNYLVTLVKMAGDLWQGFGVPQEQATHALLPLIKGTLHNIEAIGIPQCLTGPVARGDTETVRKHLDTLGNVAPALLPAYRELGKQTIPVALARGKIDKKKARELEEV
ncbi:Rossmann-like and DUF2520 domain-containing protein, partial [Chloroflexota bacterium]